MTEKARPDHKEPSWIARLIPLLATPHMQVLGREPGTQVFQGVDDRPENETYPGLLVLRFDAGLSFASADALVDRLIDLHHQAEPKLHTIVLDFEGVNFIDSQGAYTLDEIIELAGSRDVDLRLARVNPTVKELLRRDDIIHRLGENRIYGNVYEAAADKVPAAPAVP